MKQAQEVISPQQWSFPGSDSQLILIYCINISEKDKSGVLRKGEDKIAEGIKEINITKSDPFGI